MNSAYENHLTFVTKKTAHWAEPERQLILEHFRVFFINKTPRHKIGRSVGSLKTYLDSFHAVIRIIDKNGWRDEMLQREGISRSGFIEKIVKTLVESGKSSRTVHTYLTGFFTVCDAIGYRVRPANLTNILRVLPDYPKRSAQHVPKWTILRELAQKEWLDTQRMTPGYRRSLRARTALAAWFLAEFGIRARSLQELTPPTNGAHVKGMAEHESAIGNSRLEWQGDRLFLSIDPIHLKAGPGFDQKLPADLTTALIEYLAVEHEHFRKRAISNGGTPSLSLWPTECGTKQQSSIAMFKCIRRMTGKHLDKPVGPNKFRHSFAGKLLMDEAGGARVAATRLNNSVPVLMANYSHAPSPKPSEIANGWINHLKVTARDRFPELFSSPHSKYVRKEHS